MSTHALKFVDVAALSTSKPSPPLSVKASMHFINILTAEKRNLQIRVAGTFASSVMSSEYGDSFFFSPHPEEIANLAKLEDVYVNEDEDYEQKKTLNEKYQLGIKLKVGKDGKLKAKAPFKTVEDAGNDIVAGVDCLLVLSPGFYVSEEKKTYGIYYSLNQITFPAEEAPVEKETTSKRPTKKSK